MFLPSRNFISSLFIFKSIFFCLPLNAKSQLNIDSLKKVFNELKPLEQCKWLEEQGYVFYNKNPEITFVFNKYSETLSSIYLKTHPNDSIELLKQKANAINNLGFLNLNKGKIEEALSLYFKSLAIREKIKDYEGLAISYNSIGSIYNNQGETIKAKEFFEKSLAISKLLNDTASIAYCLNNIGVLLEQKGDILGARSYYLESKNFIEKTKDFAGIASVYNNIGWSYHQTHDNDSALYYYTKTLAIGDSIGDKTLIVFALSNSGKVYHELKEYDKAIDYTLKALKIAKEQGYPENIRNASSILCNIYESIKDYKNAFEMHVLFKQMSDSLRNKETEKKLVEEKLKYDFEKEKDLLKSETEKSQLLLEAKSKERNIILLFSFLGGISLISFTWALNKRLKISKKQNDIIKKQKLLLEEKNSALEIKNKDITDSINYAKRIQDALLQNKEHISAHLPEHFIIFMPKDVVSGDFYWALEKNNYLYFTVADCTGHGVPGAFMSLLGITFLNEICKKDIIQTPAEILEQLREKIITQLHQNSSEKTSRDGMDIALCRLNLKTNELVFSGANNPCWIIEKKHGVLNELRPEKQPVGIHEGYKPFTNQTIFLNKGDTVYLFSDGIIDQFGGEKGKKLKSSLLKEKLIEASRLNASEQNKFISDFFVKWKGDYEQIDDVCLLGLIAS
jgi:serine phosphatase RsbU (regulator of sigma subunit)/tetratricopeptide (TPR) repeat protein